VITIANKTISYGASGSDVKKLQEKLNSKGYSLEVDGKFGAKTQAAVRDYQKKNNLSVDGIVGNATWGSLEGSAGSKKGTSAATQSKDWSYGVSKPTYKKSGAVLEA
jgi:peptidoglycan hydrolase-like protein with peptidoglycan-binding domain